MSTYLVAFVVYDKESFTSYTDSKQQRVWSRIELADQREYALQVGSSSLVAYGKHFPDYFEYMNDKLDQVAIPDFSAGAMENWGLVTYRERSLLIHNESTTRSRRSVLTTIAHELSHQWFGDLVSPNFWNYLWLNEGFATYWSYFVDLGSLTDGWSLREQFLAEEMSAALDSDALADTHEMSTAEDTLAPFDDISYSKGGAVLRMFSEWIGEETFYSRLDTYLKDHIYSDATPSDLFSALAPGDDDILSHMMDWTTNVGYPVINVTRDGANAMLTQSRYLLTPSDSAGDTVWPINVTYVSGPDLNASMKSIMFLDNSTTIEDLTDGQPLYLNYKWTGFYRVNYDSASWDLIRQQLSSEHDKVPVETRAQLLSDAFSLARSGHIDYSLALQNSRYLNKETEYLPWAVAFRAFDFLETVVAPTDYYNSFKTYMRELLEQTYSESDFGVFREEPISRLHRVNVLEHACAAGHSPCVESANALVADAENLLTGGVEPDLRSTVYCVWAQDNELWKGLWQRYLETNVATEKVEILSALGCSQDNDTLRYYLQNAMSNVRPQDWQTVYAGVYSTPVGLDVALDFIRTNAESLMSQPSSLQKIISGIASNVVTDAQQQKLSALKDVPELDRIQSTINTALATAQAQVNWVKKNVDAIGSWLDNEVKPEPSAAPLSARLSRALLGAAALLVYLAAGLP